MSRLFFHCLAITTLQICVIAKNHPNLVLILQNWRKFVKLDHTENGRGLNPSSKVLLRQPDSLLAGPDGEKAVVGHLAVTRSRFRTASTFLVLGLLTSGNFSGRNVFLQLGIPVISVHFITVRRSRWRHVWRRYIRRPARQVAFCLLKFDVDVDVVKLWRHLDPWRWFPLTIFRLWTTLRTWHVFNVGLLVDVVGRSYSSRLVILRLWRPTPWSGGCCCWCCCSGGCWGASNWRRHCIDNSWSDWFEAEPVWTRRVSRLAERTFWVVDRIVWGAWPPRRKLPQEWRVNSLTTRWRSSSSLTPAIVWRGWRRR